MTQANWDQFLALLHRQTGSWPSVTSWWRSPAHNRIVGGVPNSKHIDGEAIDVVWDGAPPDVEKVAALAKGAGLRLVREKDHDHFESAA